MLYVVVREIEGAALVEAVFTNLEEARNFYDDAAFVCDNGPGDAPEDDPTIVSDCWLYATDTHDPNAARFMARNRQALMLATYGEM